MSSVASSREGCGLLGGGGEGGYFFSNLGFLLQVGVFLGSWRWWEGLFGRPQRVVELAEWFVSLFGRLVGWLCGRLIGCVMGWLIVRFAYIDLVFFLFILTPFLSRFCWRYFFLLLVGVCNRFCC